MSLYKLRSDVHVYHISASLKIDHFIQNASRMYYYNPHRTKLTYSFLQQLNDKTSIMQMSNVTCHERAVIIAF